MERMSFDDVDLATLTLDAISNARITARKKP